MESWDGAYLRKTAQDTGAPGEVSEEGDLTTASLEKNP